MGASGGPGGGKVAVALKSFICMPGPLKEGWLTRVEVEVVDVKLEFTAVDVVSMLGCDEWC